MSRKVALGWGTSQLCLKYSCVTVCRGFYICHMQSILTLLGELNSETLAFYTKILIEWMICEGIFFWNERPGNMLADSYAI